MNGLNSPYLFDAFASWVLVTWIVFGVYWWGFIRKH